jgi:hypothetical protein
MRTSLLLSWLLPLFPLQLTSAAVELLSGPPAAAFGGGLRTIEVLFHNRGETNVELPVGIQLLQASSATAAPWSPPRAWRSLVLAPSQTSVERALIEFPSVRAETQFWVRFVRGKDVLGHKPLLVFPDGLLTNLAHAVKSVMVLSEGPEMRRVLIEAGFLLNESILPAEDPSRPSLMITGPAFEPSETASGISSARSRAKAGLAVVLILPDEDPRMLAAPSFYPSSLGKGTLVTVRAGTLAHLATDPMAQLRLARVMRLALGRETLEPPKLNL